MPSSTTTPLDLLEVILILTTFIVTTTPSVKQIISTYRLQSILLAMVTTVAASAKAMKSYSAEPREFNVAIWILFIALLPILLAWAIKPLLVRATLAGETSTLGFLFHRSIQRQLEEEAERVWRQYKAATREQFHLLIFLILVFVAFYIAFRIIAGDFSLSERVGLAVSMALHLIGLYNMFAKQDIIAQVIGLLIMDHGLYLAVIKIVEIPVPATFFVISLYFYTLITMFILVILLPRVRRETQSIDLSEIAAKSKLKG